MTSEPWMVSRALDRRTFLIGSLALAGGALLAACGGDDDDDDVPTATTGAGAPTPTEASSGATTPTTGSTTDSTPTAAGIDPTATTAPIPPTETPSGGAPVMGGDLILARTSDSDNLDVAFSGRAIDGIVTRQINETLVFINNDLEYDPILAESYDVSEDGTTYTFTLRQDVKFHDGTDFNADAVKSSFEYMLNPPSGESQNAGFLGGILEINVTDPYTVELVFETIFAPMLANLTEQSLAISSPAAREQYGDEYRQHPVGTGPFIFEEWIPQDHITLVRNPDYVNPRSFDANKGAPYVDRYILRVIPESQTQIASLEAGEVNFMDEFPATQAPNYQDNDDVILHYDEGGTALTYLEIMMNQDGDALVYKPPFDDIRLRQAVGYAINVEEIIENVMFGLAVLNKTPMPVGVQGYNPEIGELYGFSYDPERAKALLEEVGDPGEIIFWTRQDSTSSGIGQVIQNQLQQVGFNVKFETPENSFLIADIRSPNPMAHLLINGNGTGVDPDFLFYQTDWVEGIGLYQRYSAEFKDLVTQSRQTLDVDERIQLVYDAQKIMMEDASHFPLFSRVAVAATGAKVRGFKWTAGTNQSIMDIYIEE